MLGSGMQPPVLHAVTPWTNFWASHGLSPVLALGQHTRLQGLEGMLPLCPACEGGLITPQDKFQPRLRETDSLACRCPPMQVLNL